MATALNIDWSSEESHLFLNPRAPQKFDIQKFFLDPRVRALKGHIFIATSGSTAVSPVNSKLVALSKQAFLASAQAVNQHFSIHAQDVWLNVLPHFHVGGLSIFCRAYLSQSRVIDLYHENYKWDAQEFMRSMSHATLSSVVPTQLYDLVNLNFRAPPSLRVLVVGGGYLEDSVRFKALSLGWPIFTSYGLTEACSQVATMSLQGENQGLDILSHVQVTIEEGRICLAGPSLLSCYFYYEEGILKSFDPKNNRGIFITGDLGKIVENKLIVLGRNDSVVKVGGENVSLLSLENTLMEIKLRQNFLPDLVLIAYPDDRLQFIVTLVVEKEQEKQFSVLIQNIVAAFNASVLPFERIREVFFINEIPKTPLGKIKKQEILEILKVSAKTD